MCIQLLFPVEWEDALWLGKTFDRRQVTKWAELILKKKKLEVLKEVATTDLQRDMELKRPQEY